MRKLRLPALLRWGIWSVLLLAYTWATLFSPWQALLPGPWTTLLIAMGLTHILLVFSSPGHSQQTGSELVLISAVFIYPRLIQEIRTLYTAALDTKFISIPGFLLLVAAFWVYERPGQWLREKLLNFRARLGFTRWGLAVIFLLAPLFLRLTASDTGYLWFVNTRFLLFGFSLSAAAYLGTKEPDRLVSLPALGLVLGWLLLVSRLVYVSYMVVDYPFSLSWSEGNRLYDFSLKFGQSLYNYEGTIIYPYGSPGRYLIWEAAFLWQGLPLWVHRLWNQLIYVVPPFILAWMLGRTFQPRALRVGSILAIALSIILLAPPHPPFILVAILTLVFVSQRSPYLRAAALIVASVYAYLSRFTWAVFPGAAGALIDLLLYYPQRKGTWLRRLLPTVFLALAGSLPGFLPSLGGVLSTVQGESTTGQQPLLWYRLFPNETLGPGILLQTLMVAGPWLILLAWWMLSRRWKVDWVQATAIWGALLGFLGVGIVVSMKIGGGSDLHNLDMFFMTLLFVIVIGWQAQRGGNTVQSPGSANRAWPPIAIGFAAFTALLMIYPFTPFNPAAAVGPRAVPLPGSEDVDEVLGLIRSEVAEAEAQGEVLFMDQRQLLTFGYVPAIPFVDDYEKKYVMDMAMASNAAYFQGYYQDLADRRFSLIITEPLRVNYQGDTHIFGDENDAWVRWVSEPTLCFYEPLENATLQDGIGVMLLVPREDTSDCARFLEPEE